jgi:hypothetical protein
VDVIVRAVKHHPGNARLRTLNRHAQDAAGHG